MFNQTFKDVENLNRYIVGFDMSYDEFKDLSREAWKDEDYNHLYIDRS